MLEDGSGRRRCETKKKMSLEKSCRGNETGTPNNVVLKRVSSRLEIGTVRGPDSWGKIGQYETFINPPRFLLRDFR